MHISVSRRLSVSLLSIAIAGLVSGTATAAPPAGTIEQVPDGNGGVKWRKAQIGDPDEDPSQRERRKKLLGIQSITTGPDGVKVEVGNYRGKVRQAEQGDVFVSGDKLDGHVILQAFALYQPNDNATYWALAENAGRLAQWGITDVWSPPPYRAASDSKYGEGYAIADRYDLGAYGKGPTKYGTADELRTAIGALHDQGIRVQVDVVPNQIIGLAGRQVLPVTATDMYGTPNNPAIDHQLYAAYSKGTAPGQTEHGLIKEWDNTYFNGTSPQNQGLSRVLTDAAQVPWRYFGPNDSRNYLPEWLAASDAARYGKINTVDGYLTADSWYAIENASSGSDAVYGPVLLHYAEPRSGVVNESFLDFARNNGLAGTDYEVRATIIAGLKMTPNPIGPLVDAYLAKQPGYSAGSEVGINTLRFDGPGNDASHIGQNLIDFEFLVGNDLDTTRVEVREEQANWQRYLLDFGFDGFRIDAASHINMQVLRDETEQRLKYFAGDDVNNHLSYIESYVASQVDFQQSNKFGQLVMDAGPFSGFLFSFGRDWAPLRYAFTASLVDRVNRAAAMPNWSFVNNHDQEHNILAGIPLTAEEAGGTQPGSQPYELRQFAKYDEDRNSVQKQWAPYNVPASYAILLTTKDTVPTVFYGDLFSSTQPYMSTPTPYHDDIVNLLTMRKHFAKGEQVIRFENSNTGTNGEDLVTNVRLGNDRTSGVAVVAGNDPALDTTITIDMGPKHRNQWFVDAMSYHPERLRTDKNGVLTVQVQGTQNVDVRGYLAAWVPDVAARD
ncbi:glycoside hydrolase family 70 protein [Pseudomonas cavernicola]|nr:glycoside hydrolase family 70 protein [Pseudomonas cavernicola]